MDVQTASAALMTVLRDIGYQGHEPTDPVPDEGWTVKALGVVFNIENQPIQEPLHFQNAEGTITAMRDFYLRKDVPYGIDVDIFLGSMLMGKATLRPDCDLSMAGESSVQTAK